ncbi:hypothetical protein SARC_11746, partial [Sphaeroforma arctica JP610]
MSRTCRSPVSFMHLSICLLCICFSLCNAEILKSQNSVAQSNTKSNPKVDNLSNNNNNMNNNINNNEQESDAIASIHSQIDVDNDGVVNLRESAGFLQSLIENDRERKRKDKAFHLFDSDQDDDDFVSVGELQAAWLVSAVRSWTVEDVVSWVASKPDLAAYAPALLEKGVSGKLLPVVAMGKGKMLQKWGFSAKEAEKLSQAIILETMFPSTPTWQVKDAVLGVCILLLVLSGTGLWFTSKGTKELDTQLQKMKEELENATFQLEKESKNHEFVRGDDGGTGPGSLMNSDDDLSSTAVHFPNSNRNSPTIRNFSHTQLNDLE